MKVAPRTGLTIKAKIGLGFATILSMFAVVTAIGISRVNAISDSLTHIGDINSVKQRYAINFRGSVHDRAISLRDVVVVESPAELKEALADIARLSADYEKSAVLLDKMFHEVPDISPDERAILTSIKEIEARTLPLIQKVVTLREAGDTAQAMQLMLSDARPSFVTWLARINKFIDLQEAKNNAASTGARAMASGFQTFMLIMCMAALIVGAVIAWLVIKTIRRALGGEPTEASAIAKSIAEGDLTVPITLDKNDSSSVIFTMKQMRDSLVTIVTQVRTSTDNIATVSGQIASGNMDLSSRTEQQGSALEKTAASMEEFTSTVKQNADNARQANRLAASASDIAVKGGEAVTEVVNTMEGINEASKKIVDIISVIDGIAFQTNILALNAAVEAARAGEQGRGFAVVATEVRSLAQRSAAAAKEIKTLIGDSVEKVESGSKLVEEAGNTMSQVVESVKRVTDIMAEITAASQEQASGIEQVNQAVAQMDEVTQQNTSLVEEAAAASQSMQDEATNLAQTVRVFKLSGMQSVSAVLQITKAVARPEASISSTATSARI